MVCKINRIFRKNKNRFWLAANPHSVLKSFTDINLCLKKESLLHSFGIKLVEIFATSWTTNLTKPISTMQTSQSEMFCWRRLTIEDKKYIQRGSERYYTSSARSIDDKKCLPQKSLSLTERKEVLFL